MARAVQLIFALTCLGLVRAGKNYTLQIDNNGFNVSVNGVQLLAHTKAAPMVYLGIGQLSFFEFRGNFRVNNYVQDRIGLSSFSITNTSSSTSDVISMMFDAQVTLTLTLQTTPDHPLVVKFSNVPAGFNGAWVRISAQSDEKVYGLGEQFSYLNLRNRTYPIWTREQGVGRNKSDIVTFFADTLAGGAGGDYHTTYFPQPTFVSSRRYYCHYTGSNYAEFNLQPPSFHEIFISGQLADLYFNTAPSIKGVVQSLASFLGKQPELPDWVYTGAILGVQGGTEVMMARYNKSLENDVPVSALWIQDWAGSIKTSFGSRLFWDWKWNKTLYPNLNSTIQYLKTQGVRVLAYINPNLNVKGDLYRTVPDPKYFVQNTSGQPNILDFGEFGCVTVDLTNPDGFNWYKGVIQKNMIDLGLSGWMADFGEYLPADGVVLHNGQSRDIHNLFPVLWARLNREAVEERDKLGDTVFWTRSGGSGSGNYTTIMWAGDQNVDFSYADGLPSTIPAALGMGMSGIGLNHYDIGGYTTAAQFASVGRALIRTEELLLRSAEAAIFTPMFRSHEGNQPGANVQFYSNDCIEQKFGRLASIFVYISNYTKKLVEENFVFGTPVQRPLFMEYPNDPRSWTITYQYMFGPSVLVAPVIQSKVTTMKVYLPPGTSWKFLWNGSIHQGGDFVKVDAPIGQPPVFYNATNPWALLFDGVRGKFPLNPCHSPTQAPPSTTTHSVSSASTVLSTLLICIAALATLVV